MTVPPDASDNVENKAKGTIRSTVVQAGNVHGDINVLSVARGWLIAGVAALVLIAGGVTAMATGAFRTVATDSPQSSPAPVASSSSPADGTSSPALRTTTTPDQVRQPPSTRTPEVTPKPVPPPPPPSSVHKQGTADALTPTEGIDLDDAERHPDQNTAGVDISFSASVEHLNAMDGKGVGAITVLPEAGPAERSRCARASGYARQQGGMTGLAAGRNICVKTSEERYSMLTITVPAKTDQGTVSFSYVTWVGTVTAGS
jgi:hypothetical protein